MPKMNGIEAARLIKQSWVETVIIGLCTVPDTDITDEFLKAGALAVIFKDRIITLFHDSTSFSQRSVLGWPCRVAFSF